MFIIPTQVLLRFVQPCFIYYFLLLFDVRLWSSQIKRSKLSSGRDVGVIWITKWNIYMPRLDCHLILTGICVNALIQSQPRYDQHFVMNRILISFIICSKRSFTFINLYRCLFFFFAFLHYLASGSCMDSRRYSMETKASWIPSQAKHCR